MAEIANQDFSSLVEQLITLLCPENCSQVLGIIGKFISNNYLFIGPSIELINQLVF